MLQYFNVILSLFDRVYGYLDQYVFDSYHQLAVALRVPLALCIVIYVVLLGYAVSQGWLNLSIGYIVRLSLKFGVIYSLAMNWQFFSHNVIDFVQQGSSQLAVIILKSNHNFSSLNTQHGIEGALQSILIHFTKIGYWLWRRGSWHSISPYFEAIVIWGSGITLIFYAVLQLLIAHIMLSILFVLAPLFISFLIFDTTQRLFDRWAGYIIGYALMTLFVSLLLSLVLDIAQWSVSGINQNNLMNTLYIVSFVPILLICLISVALMKRVSIMAQNIGLNFSIFSIKRLIHEAIS